MKLPPAQAALLGTMLEGGGFATYGALMAAAGIERGHGDDRALRVAIFELRRAIRAHGVEVIDMNGLGFGIPFADLDAARELRGKK